MTLEKSKRCTNDLIMEKSLGGTCLTSATNVKKKSHKDASLSQWRDSKLSSVGPPAPTQVAALGLHTLTESTHLTIYNITHISALQTTII